MNILHRSCPECGKDNRDQTPGPYSRDGWQVKACSHCGFVYLENCPQYEDLSVNFAWEKTSEEEKHYRKKREPRKQFVSDAFKRFRQHYLKRDKLFDLIGRYFKPGNVLDIGCASGGILCRLGTDFTPYGVEISEQLATEARHAVQPRGGDVMHADAVTGVSRFDDNFFSGIIMSAFLEHEMNPGKLLQKSFDVSAPGGMVIIKVPNYGSLNRKVRGPRWCGFRYPDHVNYFTPASLKKMCRASGFDIRQFGFPDKHPVSDNMWIVLTKNMGSPSPHS